MLADSGAAIVEPDLGRRQRAEQIEHYDQKRKARAKDEAVDQQLSLKARHRHACRISETKKKPTNFGPWAWKLTVIFPMPASHQINDVGAVAQIGDLIFHGVVALEEPIGAA